MSYKEALNYKYRFPNEGNLGKRSPHTRCWKEKDLYKKNLEPIKEGKFCLRWSSLCKWYIPLVMQEQNTKRLCC